MRLGPALLWPLAACRALVEPDVSYRDCDLTSYEEPLVGSSTEALFEHCWRLDSGGVDPSEVFVDGTDGDVIIRINEPTGLPKAQWQDGDRGPLLYQRILAGDFVMVTRVEALDLVDSGHCLERGNMAGLAARSADDPSQWATLLIGPYASNDVNCVDEPAENVPPAPTLVQARSSSWGGMHEAKRERQIPAGVGNDGEADIALCRFGEQLRYFYRDPTSPTSKVPPDWVLIGTHEAVEGPIDIGLTAAGAEPTFSVEAHFNWIAFKVGPAPDNCNGPLDDFVIPPL